MHVLSTAVLSGGLIEIDPTLFLQVGIFLILFFILRALVFKPVLAVMDARHQAIDGAKDEAWKREHEADERMKDYEQQLREARAKAAEEREKLRQDGLAQERKILQEARNQAEQALQQAQARLAEESQAAREQLQSQVPELAGDITSKLLGREVRS